MKNTILLFVLLLFSLGCNNGLATTPPTPSFVTISPQTATVTCDVDGCTPQTIKFTAAVEDQTGKNLMPNATVGFSIGVNAGSVHPNATIVSQGQTATVTFLPALPPGGTVYTTAIITTFGGTLVKSQATITVTQQ
jgi:hypothetical protein